MIDGLSPSSLGLWDQCPRKFRFEKFDGRTDSGVSLATERGTFGHRVLELLMDDPPPMRTIERAREHALRAWADHRESDDWKSLEVSPADEMETPASAWEAIVNWFDMEDPQTIDVHSTELYLEAVIDDVPVRGIIDRLDRGPDGLVVVDYKYGKAPDARYAAPKLRQLVIYALMVEQVYGERPKRGRLVFPTYKREISTAFSEAAFTETRKALRGAWLAIAEAERTDRFVPQPGPLCGWCPFVGECPEGLAEVRTRFKEGRLKPSAPAWKLVAE